MILRIGILPMPTIKASFAASSGLTSRAVTRWQIHVAPQMPTCCYDWMKRTYIASRSTSRFCVLRQSEGVKANNSRLAPKLGQARVGLAMLWRFSFSLRDRKSLLSSTLGWRRSFNLSVQTQNSSVFDAETEREMAASEGPIPRITEDMVTVSFARSGGPGGQNVNKVNTKVDMRFNVMGAAWLPERVRMKLLQAEKNRINSSGELVVSSTRTRTQKGNIGDALEKLQAMIDAAAYVPPEPSEEKKKRIVKLEQAEERRRLQEKKKKSMKKADRRNKGSWD